MTTNVEDIFQDKALLKNALTHRSWINENRGSGEHNERLEFLGDAILEYIVSVALYKAFPDKPEGFLTALRSNLVNTQNLALVAKSINLGELIHLSKGEIEGGGRENSALLADTLEAVIGAMYLDSGLTVVESFVEKTILVDLDKKAQDPLKDPKSMLQEAMQSRGEPAPKYKVVSEMGPDHAKRFVVAVFIRDLEAGQGEGKNKSEAEQKAAEKALINLPVLVKSFARG